MVEQTSEERQKEIEARAAQIDSNIAGLRSDLNAINQAIQEKQSQNPEYNAKGDRRRAELIGVEIDKLSQERGLLNLGYTPTEAHQSIQGAEIAQINQEAIRQGIKLKAGEFINQGIVFNKEGQPIAATSQQAAAKANQLIAQENFKARLAAGQTQSSLFQEGLQSREPFSRATPQQLSIFNVPRFQGFFGNPVDLITRSRNEVGIIEGTFGLFGFQQPSFSNVYKQVRNEGTTIVTNFLQTPLYQPTGSREKLNSLLKINIPKIEYKENIATKTLDVLAPKTIGGLIGFAAFPIGYKLLPSAARIAFGTFATLQGSSQALNPSLLPEQRIAGGFVAGLGAFGTIVEGYPYAKGFVYEQKLGYSSVKIQQEGFAAIEVKSADFKRVGLILEKAPLKSGLTSDVKLPSTSPLVRGGFGVQEFEKALFIGKNQAVATSQIGFFKQGVSIPLEREFFVTPQEPYLKIPETRISRLGLTNLFEIPKNAEFSFSLPKQAQIGIEFGASVTRSGRGTSYALGKGTELEAIKGLGSTITDVNKIGFTTIKGQAIDIFSFKTGTTQSLSSFKLSSISIPTTKISGQLGIATLLSITQVKAASISLPTASLNKQTKLIFGTKSLNKVSSFSISLPKSFSISLPTSFKSPPKSPPLTPNKSPSISLNISLPSYPKLPPSTPPKSPPLTPTISPPKSPPRNPLSIKGLNLSLPKFPVFLRRFGKFKLVGFGKTEAQAFNIGRFAAANTLGATFKVPTARIQPTRIKGFKSKKTTQGTLFIELPKFRLSTLGEVREIQSFRNKSTRRKR